MARAKVHTLLKHWKQAKKDYKKGISLNSGDAICYIGLADVEV